MQTKFRIHKNRLPFDFTKPWVLETPNKTVYWFNSFESAVFNFNVLLKGRV